jgi:hypothetical protein
MTETTASTTARRSTRRTRVVGALTVAVALGTLGVGCSDSKDDSVAAGTAEASTSTSSTVASGTTGGESTGGGSTGNTGGNTGGGSTGGGNSGGGAKVTPVINSFTTPENIDCHNGNLQNFTVSWSTTNATKVTISIDGPGIYDTYGPSGETSLPFNCSSSHTFLLTATSSDGTTATKQVTLQPRNVQPQGGEDEDQQ